MDFCGRNNNSITIGIVISSMSRVLRELNCPFSNNKQNDCEMDILKPLNHDTNT